MAKLGVHRSCVTGAESSVLICSVFDAAQWANHRSTSRYARHLLSMPEVSGQGMDKVCTSWGMHALSH